jgi:hypothetical protein
VGTNSHKFHRCTKHWCCNPGSARRSLQATLEALASLKALGSAAQALVAESAALALVVASVQMARSARLRSFGILRRTHNDHSLHLGKNFPIPSSRQNIHSRQVPS